MGPGDTALALPAARKDAARRGPLDDTLPAPPVAPPQPLPDDMEAPVRPPAPQDRYRLGAELGRGGMGRVVEAFDIQLGRTVALKEVLPKGGRGTVRRFEREVQLTARLEHPSIVPIYDSGVTQDGRPFYVMRRVSGRPFDELVSRARGLGERLTLLPALLAAIDAVGHAHKRGVIHRDLKPQNILVGELGETIVIDWGLAKMIGEEDELSGERTPSASDSLQTQMGSVFGTPGFMSPEQARGEELGTRGDVYALGATLYQLLAGTPPHQGISATEVIDKTARHDVKPLAEVAPGAPKELVAIVDKALSFEPRKRYPNAGALGEDVRRFLAGQLVAAHRYTKRQKVARFAKRHRAPLGVAALALALVAVLAWIGVARIITERDAADTARAEAVEGKHAAELARDAQAERHDALVVTQARALLDTNPTEAAATLKQLSPKSPRYADARAIAQAAAARGVAWALEGSHDFTVATELDPTGRLLLQITRDGTIRVWDVEQRKLVVARAYARDTRGIWVAGGLVLVIHAKSPPQLLDPVANTSEPLAVDPIALAVASERGERVLFTTAARGAKLLDVAPRTVIDLDTEHKLTDLAIAPDGSWFAFADRDSGLFVVDAAKRELARRTGRFLRVTAGTSSLAALAEDGSALECKLAPAAVWTVVPMPIAAPHRVIDLIYRGAELDLWATNGTVYGWNGKRVFQLAQYDRMTQRMFVAGDRTLVVPGVDGKLHFVNDLVRGTLTLPGVVPRNRIATRPGSPNIVVVGDGVVTGFDLSRVVPRIFRVGVGMQAMFIDDHTLLTNPGVAVDWQWMDVATGAIKPFQFPLGGLPQVTDVDAASGRVLVREVGGRTGQRMLLLRKGSTEVRPIVEGRAVWARLIPGDAIVFGTGDGRLSAQIGNEPPAEIAKLDGVVETAVGLGYRQFAAHSSGGELVRGDLTKNTLDRTRVAVGGAGFVASDSAGRVLIIEDDRLLRWDAAAVIELAKFDKPIVRLEPVEGGAAVHLADHEVQIIELEPGAVPQRVLAPAKRPASTAYDGTVIVGLGNSEQLHVVELPSKTRWTMPVLFSPNDVLTVSPTSRHVIQGSDYHLAIWTLPKAGDDLGAFLDELTNATVDAGGVLAWPWQRARRP